MGQYRSGGGCVSKQFGSRRSTYWLGIASNRYAEWLYVPFAGVGVLLLVLRSAFGGRERVVFQQWHVLNRCRSSLSDAGNLQQRECQREVDHSVIRRS